jgi:16S rRNA (cytosine1402-N4)-methyltransferase
MRPHRRTDSTVHIPVLREAVLQHLDITPGLTLVDATLGAGGHSLDLLEHITPGGTLIGIDRDPMMLKLAARRLQSSPVFDPQHHHLCQGSYVTLPDILAERNIPRVDRALADLGLSSDQLADPQRGFGFQAGGPLDLRFDVSQGEPAHQILQTRSADELAEIFREFGEERHGQTIADRIVKIRKHSPVRTADELARIVESLVPSRGRRGTHPATRVFQALRIAANHELEHVATFVNEVLPEVLASGGRAAVITFHSLEDRIVKNAFRSRDIWESVTKKPVTATAAEKRHNPRSRSAKLRVAVRK